MADTTTVVVPPKHDIVPGVDDANNCVGAVTLAAILDDTQPPVVIVATMVWFVAERPLTVNGLPAKLPPGLPSTVYVPAPVEPAPDKVTTAEPVPPKQPGFVTTAEPETLHADGTVNGHGVPSVLRPLAWL